MPIQNAELSSRRRLPTPWLVALAYLILGLGAYASILHTYFVADDFSYLDAIKSATSPAVIFSPLAERYFRPMAVLVYYLNYQISGLDPLTYHVSVVLMNVVNAWLIFMIARTLTPSPPPFVPVLAGLLFLVFGGHAEAVTWIGGMADPLVTLFVLLAFWLFLKALDSERPLLALLGTWGAFAAALLSKESATVFLGLAAAGAVLARPQLPAGRVARILGLTLSACAVLLLAYITMRKAVLGFAFVNLEGLGTNSNWVTMGAVFGLRSFIPQGALLTAVVHGYWYVWLIVPLGLVLAWRVPKTEYRSLVLLAVCFAASLVPVLPLSISVVTPESERLIYMASAFASLLLVWFLGASVNGRWLVGAIVLALVAGNLLALTRINRNWQEASAITHGTLTTFADTMRSHGRIGSAVYLINAPDNVRGAYIFRRGFHEALRLTAPDQVGAMAETRVLSVYSISDPSMPVRVTPLGPRSLQVHMGGGWLIGAPNPTTPTLALRNWTAQTFVADFTDLADGSLVVYFSPHATAIVGRLPLQAQDMGGAPPR